MLQVKPDKPLNPLLATLMRKLDEVARQLKIPYFVIGATARDILMEHVHALDTMRATRDVDFAVAVPSWQAYDQLKAQLIGTGAFVQANASQRLIFGAGPGAYPLDLVPFYGVERNGEIAWPPDGDFVMNIAGYTEAHASAVEVEIMPGFAIKVVSLPAMAVLKILAWKDRPDHDKHASDVLLLLRHYHEAGQTERLYDDEAALLTAHDYDLELAGAALLGRDANRDVTAETCSQACNLFLNKRSRDQFLAQARRASHYTTERTALLLDAFLHAMNC